MKAPSETGLGLVAHLYQIRPPKNPTFPTFFKLHSMLVLSQITDFKRFNFFLHIDCNSAKIVIITPPKSNTGIFKN